MRPGDDTTSDLVGQTIGNFRIDAELGAGGMSTVYRGTHLRLERVVALKILHGRFSEEPSFQARFLREAQVAAQLRHRNIIGIVDSGVTDGRYFIAMEYIQGRTLSEILREGRLPLPLAVSYVRQIAAALDHAHMAGVIHRDIKPSNVIIRPDGTAVLVDFGIAKAIEESQSDGGGGITMAGAILGTPAYIAPEQARGNTITHRADIYSLGCLAFELLTGKSPFAGRNFESMITGHLTETPPLVTELVPELPAAAGPVVAMSLLKNPFDRFPTAGTFADALGAAIEDAETLDLDALTLPAVPLETPVAATPAPEPAPVPVPVPVPAPVIGPPRPPVDPAAPVPMPEMAAAPTRKQPWLLPLIGLALVLAIVAVVVLANGDDTSGNQGDVATRTPAATARASAPATSSTGNAAAAQTATALAAIVVPSTATATATQSSPATATVPLANTPSPTATEAVAVLPTDTPVVAPPTGRITFQSQQDGGDYDVFVINSDGTGQQNLTPDSVANDLHPTWSPDGTRIVFASDRTGGFEIWVMNADGSDPAQLTDSVDYDYAPAWSPDGTRIAFQTKRDGNSNIYVMNADGTEQRPLTDSPAIEGQPTWSPDSALIVYEKERTPGAGDYDLWIANADGTDQRALLETDLLDTAACWLPDGSAIAYTAVQIDGTSRRTQVGLVAPDGSNARLLWPNSVIDNHLCGSPDGEWFSFQSFRDGNFDVFVARLDGSSEIRLTTAPEDDSRPRWGP